jgi:hypothetical protein
LVLLTDVKEKGNTNGMSTIKSRSEKNKKIKEFLDSIHKSLISFLTSIVCEWHKVKILPKQF